MGVEISVTFPPKGIGQAGLQDDPHSSPFDLIMVHDLYCIQALMGGAEPSSFQAQSRKPHEGGSVDLALAQLKWGDDTIASFAASFLTPPGMGTHGYDRLEVMGDGWSARLNPNPRPIQIWDNCSRYPLGIEIRPNPTGPTGMLAEELRAFARAVRGLEPIPVGATYDDAMQVQGWVHKLVDVSN